MIYGGVTDGKDDFVEMGEENVTILSETLSGYFVDYIPLCELSIYW